MTDTATAKQRAKDAIAQQLANLALKVANTDAGDGHELLRLAALAHWQLKRLTSLNQK